MATVTKRGSNQNTSGGTVTLSPTAQINVGEFIVVVATGRDNPVSTVADNSTQTGTANSYTKDASYETAGQDAFCWIYSCRVTRNILTSDTITVTFSPSGGAHGIAVFLLDPIESSTPFDKSSSRRYTTVSSPWTSNATATTAQADEVLIGAFNMAAQTSNRTDGNTNPDSPWVEQYYLTAGSSNFLISSQVVASTGTYAHSGVLSDGSGGTAVSIIGTYKVAAGGNSPPVNTVAPAVTGNKWRTQTLTTTDGTWTGTPTPTYTYQWQRDNSGGGSYSNISGATANTRVLDANDVGCQVRCVVTGTNSEGNASANSNASTIGQLYTAPVAGTGRVEVCGGGTITYTGASGGTVIQRTLLGVG